MTISGLLKEYVNRYSDYDAFAFLDAGKTKTIKVEMFYQYVKKAESYFRENISGSGNRIGIVGENSFAYIIMLFGIICSENIAVPLNHTYADEILCDFFDKAKLSSVICDEDYLKGLEQMHLQIPMYAMEECFQNILVQPQYSIKECGGKTEDVILMLLSSGTSGVSKIVEITNENLCAFPYSVLEYEQEMPQNSLLLLPFYHISGIIPMLEDMMRGNLTYISSAKYLVRDINQYKVDKLILVPAMMKKVLQHCEKSKEFKASCQNIKEALCLGAPMDDDLLNKLEAASIIPKVYYGMTETTGTVSGIGAYKRGACGKIASFCEVKIHDGEILVRGKNIMKGYFDDVDETNKVFESGWLHTGDLGEVDEDGYLFIKGRKKNTIILSNGENVCPEELENGLQQCEWIEECRVFGADDLIKAEVFCTGEPKSEEVHLFVKEYVRTMNRSLPPSHKIKEIQFRDCPLEKNSMGKIIRNK